MYRYGSLLGIKISATYNMRLSDDQHTSVTDILIVTIIVVGDGDGGDGNNTD
jgi:hypothetical protein